MKKLFTVLLLLLGTVVQAEPQIKVELHQPQPYEPCVAGELCRFHVCIEAEGLTSPIAGLAGTIKLDKPNVGVQFVSLDPGSSFADNDITPVGPFRISLGRDDVDDWWTEGYVPFQVGWVPTELNLHHFHVATLVLRFPIRSGDENGDTFYSLEPVDTNDEYEAMNTGLNAERKFRFNIGVTTDEGNFGTYPRPMDTFLVVVAPPLPEECRPFDTDRDGDVDAVDFERFQACASGPLDSAE